MEFRQIRYALSVAKERSFTKAAARLNISQSAVSEQVRLLEAEVGFQLFQRTSRGIDVTDSGRTFLNEAERVVADVLSLADTARLLRGGSADNLTLGIVSGAAQLFMPALFHEFSAVLRGIRLRVITTPTKNIFTDLHEGRIDAGIAIESDPDRVPAGLISQPLVSQEMVLIASPHHPVAKKRSPIPLATLATESIVMSELAIGYGEFIMSLFADLGLRPNILAVADNVDTMKAIVESGQGVAIVPRACARNEVALRLLKLMRITPARKVMFSLFRRRQPESRQKETRLASLLDALRQSGRHHGD